MSLDHNHDQKIAENGRSFTLKDDPEQELEVTAPLRDQIVKKLVTKLEDGDEGSIIHQLSNVWHTGNSHRQTWLDRQEAFVLEFDEFLEPKTTPANTWNSNLHLPTIFTVCKTFHARFFSALLGVSPPFTVQARKQTWEENEDKIQDLMQYAIEDWANYNQGVEETCDRWLWDWITTGTGLLKVKWDKKYSSYLDVESELVQGSRLQTDDQGNLVEIPTMETVEREVKKTELDYDGPIFERVNVEDLLIIGGEGNPQNADYVFQQEYMTASELWTLVDQGIFSHDAVQEIIEQGRSSKAEGAGTAVKQARADSAGDYSIDKVEEKQRYLIIECHAKLDVNDSGIDSDVIVWFHPNLHKVLRATYAKRVYPHASSGLIRPFFKIDFHKRQGQIYGAGIPELLYSIAKEIDAIHNMRIDNGIISTTPFGFYRPASSMETEEMHFEPGMFIPVDNPGDVVIPNFGNRTAFGFQEEQALYQQIERLTSISDINLGIIGGQGATRTATGTRALIGEANANLDIFLRRMNRGWSQALKFLFSMMQTRLPKNLQFRVVGEDGVSYWRETKSREEIAGMYDFKLEANSANSNPQIRKEVAQLVYQMTQNPLDYQLGIFSPLERYHAIIDVMKSNGIKNVSKFSRKPQARRQFLPIEILELIVAGQEFQFQPIDDLQGYIELAQQFVTEQTDGKHEVFYNEDQVARVQASVIQAVEMLQALQQAGQQTANLNQQFTNSQNTQQQTQAPVAVNANTSIQSPEF